MKTTAKHLTTFGNLALVQFKVEPESVFPFRAGTDALRTGELVISESTSGGEVGQLRAFNKSTSYLLLTDGDVLTGAKQNRVLNKSVLLAPLKETIIDVSCVERLRWHYTERTFSSSQHIADSDLRKEKAASVSSNNRTEEAAGDTQQKVWSHIQCRFSDMSLESETESYDDLINFSIENRREHFPVVNPEGSCNGLAILLEGELTSIEIFGKEEIYRIYFRKLVESAFQLKGLEKNGKPTLEAEAYFKTLDALDSYEVSKKQVDESYTGAGVLRQIEHEALNGFELSIEDQLVHCILFGNKLIMEANSTSREI